MRMLLMKTLLIFCRATLAAQEEEVTPPEETPSTREALPEPQTEPQTEPEPPAAEEPQPTPAEELPPPATTASSTDPLLYYLEMYGADYVAVLAVGALYAAGTTNAIQPFPALIGPSMNLDKPDLNLIMDPRLDDVIGRPILNEKAPNISVPIAIAVAGVAVAGTDLALQQDAHRTHNIVLGLLEASLGAVAITETMKLTFGRLRPDFRERWVRAACAGIVTRPEALDCSGVDDGFVVDRDFLLDGMKSFPSGHSSSSFGAATFLGLVIGGKYIWRRDLPEWAPPLGALAAGTLLAGAGYISATRVGDNRHHIEDVTVGALVGVTTGAAAYFLHFDAEGNARRRGITVAPMPIPGGGGVAVAGSL